MSLDAIHHFAIFVADLEKAINWYQTSFSCNLLFRDSTQAVLEFANIRLTLTLPSTQPQHLAVIRNDAAQFGELRPRPDGTSGTYLSDPSGNVVEIVLAQQGDKWVCVLQ